MCGQRDMGTLITIDYDSLWDTPSAANCEFRLFLEPDSPLTWTANEYFLGGSFWFVFCKPSGCSPEGISTFDMSMKEARQYLAQIKQRLFWGKASTPDANLKELQLQKGPIFLEGDGRIAQQTYYVFPPQAPGLYKWRYEYDDHTIWKDVARGEIAVAKA